MRSVVVLLGLFALGVSMSWLQRYGIVYEVAAGSLGVVIIAFLARRTGRGGGNEQGEGAEPSSGTVSR